MTTWECASCGAVTDREVVMPGEPYHEPDDDCRSVAPAESETQP